MKYKLIAAAVLAAGMNNLANATIITPSEAASNGANNLGGSELVLSLWDGTNTFNVDLGVQMGSLANAAANVPASLGNISTNALAAGFFTNGVLNSNVQWGVMAADAVASATAATSASEYGQRMLTTSTTATWNYNNALVTGSVNALGSYIANLNLQPGQYNVANGSDLSTSVIDLNSWQGAGMLNSWAQNGAFTALGTGAGSMLFVQAAQSYTGTPPRPTSSASAAPNFNTVGQFTLAANGQLSFAPVPIPAAVWLFSSALMGLVGVARRRNTSV
ncbi:MAG: hypothetical protein HY080_02965 [Gammaproteobacteria bacterium]|nr:hypothetical protein [Gammaproteobacteria bacterium]